MSLECGVDALRPAQQNVLFAVGFIAPAIALDLVPDASFDEGLAVVAPVRLRARNFLRLVLLGPRGRGLKPGAALTARDLDRLLIRCDRPLPLQVDGEDAGDVTEAVYEAERDAVSVLV